MRTKRTRIATGIYRDTSGIAVVTKVNGVQREQRFTLDSDLRKLIAFRANWLVERSTEPREPTAPYWAACEQYLKTIPEDADGSKRKANAYNDLHCWRPTFHGLNVRAITSQMIRQQLAQWTHFAASTRNKRRQELKNLFTYLGGPNPVVGVPLAKERHDDARAVRPDVVDALLTQLGESDSKRRLRVMWETSLALIDLTRIREADFRPSKKTLFVPARHKGAGSPAITMSLTAAAVRALQAFFAAGLEGTTCSSGTLWRDFKHAEAKAKAAWDGPWPAPANFSPKDLRHSRLTEALRHSNNLQGVQQLARHKHIQTTLRYVRALEHESMAQVVKAMDGAIRSVPSGTVKTRQNKPKRPSSSTGRSPRKK